jgi:CRISPR-associated protein Csm1
VSDRFEVALGALLHDLGKIAERAGVAVPPEEVAGLRKDASPDGAYSHAVHSAHLLRRFWPERSLAFAARHHHPTGALDATVAVAARYAATGGRAETDETGLSAGESRRRRLEPALARVRLEGAVPPREVCHLPLRPLSFRPADLDPASGDGPTSVDLARDEYFHGLWDALEQGLGALPQDPRAAIPAALALLERLAGRVPATPAEAQVDVSLFDHSRLTAALATALYIEVVEGRDEADRALAKEMENAEAPRFLAYLAEVRGESSELPELPLFAGLGPQVGPGALTGRTVWLALLLDALAQRILSGLELPATSLLHLAGTRLLLLLPHSAAARLDSLASEIDLALVDLYGGKLQLCFGAVPLALADLHGARLSARLAELSAALEVSAERPFADLLARAHGYEAVFAPSELPRGRCPVCGDDLEAPEGPCGACARFEALGRMAAKARGFARVSFEAQVRAERALREAGAKPVGNIAFEPLRQAYIAVGELPEAAVDLGVEGALLATGPEGGGAPHARCIGLAPPPRRGGDAPCGSLSTVARGAHRWGALFVDLDGIVALLERGFPESERSFARMLGLSRSVHHFFSGFAASLAVRDDAVHVVRVGGDELWAVAPWDHLPGLALAIRDALHRYTGGNVAIGLSAGIALGAKETPVGEVLERAGAALGRATRFVHRDGRRKDALSLFGAEVAWGDAALAAEIAQTFADAAPAVRASLLPRLRTIAESARAQAPASLPEVGAALRRGRWTWRMVARLGELARTAGDRSTASLPLRVRRALVEDEWEGRRHEQPLTDIFDLAVRWCRLLTMTEAIHERRAAPR